MTKNTSGKFNKYITDYEKLRNFLRNISYGCFHRQYLVNKLGYNKRKYDNYWSQARSFLPMQRLIDRTHRRRKYHSLRGDRYYGAYNHLSKSFHITAVSPNFAFVNIAVLQILNAATKPLTINEIIDAICSPNTMVSHEYFNAVSSSLNRALKKMEENGLIIGEKQHRVLTYKLSPNPLLKLNTLELKMLRNAMTFYRNDALLSFPFYYLEETICTIGNFNLPKRRPFAQFTRTPLVNILDELNAAFILDCINDDKALQFIYNENTVTAQPMKIVRNYYTGHQYMMAYDTSSRPIHQRYRLDKMSYLKSMPKSNIPAPPPQPLSQLALLLHTTDEQDLQRLKHKILLQYDKAIFTKGEPVMVKIKMADTLQALPWLRTLHPQVEIVKPSWLRERIIQDLKEVMANYEQAK